MGFGVAHNDWISDGAEAYHRSWRWRFRCWRIGVRAKLRTKCRAYLGVDVEVRELRKDVLSLMEKQIRFQEQYPVEDREMIPVDPPLDPSHITMPRHAIEAYLALNSPTQEVSR